MLKCPDAFNEAKQYAQKLADAYHRPYYVVRGHINYWTSAAWPSKKGKSYEVLPADGKIDLTYF